MVARTLYNKHRAETVFPSLLRTEATFNSDELGNSGARGCRVYVDITAEAGTATLDMKLQQRDPISGDYIDIGGASIAQLSAVTTGPVMLTIHPDITASANVIVKDVLPAKFRIVLVIGGSTVSMTCSVAIERFD